MSTIGSQIQSADWKAEKHAPTIVAPDSVKAGEAFQVKAVVGEELAHPNTTEHHIAWIELYYKPDDEKFPINLGRFNFSAHGESAKGANEGPAFTEPRATTTVALKKSGTLMAMSYCNIHGLWEAEKAITVA